jgi:hypothetical protein
MNVYLVITRYRFSTGKGDRGCEHVANTEHKGSYTAEAMRAARDDLLDRLADGSVDVLHQSARISQHLWQRS